MCEAAAAQLISSRTATRRDPVDTFTGIPPPGVAISGYVVRLGQVSGLPARFYASFSGITVLPVMVHFRTSEPVSTEGETNCLYKSGTPLTMRALRLRFQITAVLLLEDANTTPPKSSTRMTV